MRGLFGFALGAALCGCPATDGGPDAGGDAGAAECQVPETEHARLLNAPTAAAVIRKTPAHPPTDGGLP